MEYYYEILSFHILSVLSWMSMLFYLPRLFVYHIENKNITAYTDIVKVQEYKLYKYIGMPAMWASISSGISLLYVNSDLLNETWMEFKILILCLMIIFSFSIEVYRKQLSNNVCRKSSKFFRVYNEIPTLLVILIVVSVVTKNLYIYFNVSIFMLLALVIFILIKTSYKDTSKK